MDQDLTRATVNPVILMRVRAVIMKNIRSLTMYTLFVGPTADSLKAHDLEILSFHVKENSYARLF